MKRNVKLWLFLTSATAAAIAIPMQNRINELEDSNKVNQALMNRGFKKGITMFDGFNPVEAEEVNMEEARESIAKCKK